MPSNIRFVCFKGCISRESVQALCILLKKQNGAFIAPTRRETEALVHTLSRRPSGTNSGVGAVPVDTFNGFDMSGSSGVSSDSIHPLSPRSPESSSQAVFMAAARSRPLKGLLGLSITHTG